MKLLLKEIFGDVNRAVEIENTDRRKSGTLPIAKSEAKILGQLSLLVNEKIAGILALAQTADLDALLRMEAFVVGKLREILATKGLVYDEDSSKIWIPKSATFENLFDFKNVQVKVIDPESALVSKAVKAPQKNKFLIRQAIASLAFPNLADRIVRSGGDLEYFSRM